MHKRQAERQRHEKEAEPCYRNGDRFPSVPVATKIAHFFGWEVEETIAGLMKDLARRDDTGE